jgi:hypothetical protein
VTVALLVSLATAIEEWQRRPDLIDQAARSTGATSTEVNDEQTFTSVFYGIILVLHIVAVSVFVGLAIPVSRGRNGARIALTVVAGLSSLCCGGLVALVAFAPEPAQQSAFEAELSGLEQTTSPAWSDIAAVISGVFVGVVPLVVLILLFVPPSNTFFRKPAPTDSFGGYGYPQYGYYWYPGSAAPPPPGPQPPGPPPPGPPPPGPPAVPPGPPA